MTQTVNNDTIDVGVHPLTKGATIRGKIVFCNSPSVPDQVQTVDSHGVIVQWFDFGKKNSADFDFVNLWPGEWKIRLVSENKVTAEQMVVLEEKGNAACEIKAP